MNIIFTDRDGVLNDPSLKQGKYVSTVEDWKLFSFVPAAIQKLKAAGYQLIVVTNQAGIAHGQLEVNDLEEIHELLRREAEGSILDIFYCPTKEEGPHTCRKPSPKMILYAAQKHNVDPKECFMIGDAGTDIEAGKNAGCKTILVKTGRGQETLDDPKLKTGPDFVVENFAEAIDTIIKKEREST